MSTTISIKFLRPAVANETVYFTFYANYPNTTEFVRSSVAKASRVNPGEFAIGANVNAQAQNYYDAFLLDYGTQFAVQLSGDTVFITPNNDSTIFNASTSLQPPFTQLVEFNIYPTDIDVDVIRARSPYLLIKPSDIGGTCGIYLLGVTGATGAFTYDQCLTGNSINKIVGPSSIEYSTCAIVGSVVGPSGSTITYDSACDGSFDYDTTKYIIKTWTGDLNQIPTTISYSKTKQKVVNSQTDIYINLSNLVREQLEGDVDNYILSTGLTAAPIGVTESKWVNVITNFLNIGVTGSVFYDDTFFVLDGYTEPRETQGLPDGVLLSDTQRTYHYGAKAKIHFVSKDLVSIQAVLPGATSGTPIAFNTDWQYSDKYVQAIDIDTTQNLQYLFEYPAETEVISTYVTDSDCKYQNFVVMFKNKWGVIESVCFNKKSSRTLSTEDSSYLRSIVDYNGAFNVSRHTNKVYNTSGYEEWTLNTDWLPEYMNTPLQELMLSEEIWLFDGVNPTPINKSDTSISYKTNVNDKLIQYTMKFKLSHNTINNIL